MWKAMHLLYLYQNERGGLTFRDLGNAGIDCFADTIIAMRNSGLIQEVEDTYVISEAGRLVLTACLVACRRRPGDIWVDYPLVFPAMPFSEDWSNDVYSQMIKPAAKDAGLECARADEKIQIGDIGSNIWDSILRAGLVVADVSVPNANVFYELGIAHALGKYAILLKRRDTSLPADFGGVLYYEYSLDDLESGRSELAQALRNWAQESRAMEVKRLRDQVMPASPPSRRGRKRTGGSAKPPR
jgi:hypothetical protein